MKLSPSLLPESCSRLLTLTLTSNCFFCFAFELSTNCHQLEKKKLEYEYLKEQRRRFEAEMELLDLQSRRDEEEIHRLSSDIQYGKHSQPTTPPEHKDNNNGFPSAFSRPNRFSMSSINSPAMGGTRTSRSGSQITSPPSVTSTQATIGAQTQLPSKSMPGSRRNSDEEAEDDYDYEFAPMSPVYRRYVKTSSISLFFAFLCMTRTSLHFAVSALVGVSTTVTPTPQTWSPFLSPLPTSDHIPARLAR